MFPEHIQLSLSLLYFHFVMTGLLRSRRLLALSSLLCKPISYPAEMRFVPTEEEKSTGTGYTKDELSNLDQAQLRVSGSHWDTAHLEALRVVLPDMPHTDFKLD
jgi:hypothetical protein